MVEIGAINEFKDEKRSRVDFPNAVLFFTAKIASFITNEHPQGYNVPFIVETSDYPYCYDVFGMVRKVFNPRGYYISTPTFKLTYIGGRKLYSYSFLITVKSDDDLPF